MKKYLAIIATLFFSFIIVNEAQAYNFGDTGRYTIMSGVGRNTRIITNNNGQTQTWNNPLSVNGSLQFVETTSVNGGQVSQIYLELQAPLPKSLFHFSIRWTTPGSRYNVNYMGITPSGGWSLLDSTCFPQVDYANNSQTNATDIICDYFGYTDGDLNAIFMSGNMMNITTDGFIIVINGVDYVEVSNESGGGSGGYADLEDDINTIINRITTNNTQNTYINYNIEDIKEILETISDEQLTEEKIADVIEQSRQAEQQQYEEQQEDVSDAGTEAKEEASQATSSLTQNVSNIINAIIDQPATNCNIRIQRGAFDTGQLNLCNTTQPIKTMILMIIAIPITLAVLRSAYELVMLYLDRIREEQE